MHDLESGGFDLLCVHQFALGPEAYSREHGRGIGYHPQLYFLVRVCSCHSKNWLRLSPSVSLAWSALSSLCRYLLRIAPTCSSLSLLRNRLDMASLSG